MLHLLDEAPPPLDTTEGWTNRLAGAGLLGNKGRGMDLQYLGFQQGEFFGVTMLVKLINH